METYINLNKHLPDIPSETEISQKGYDLIEMNGLLLMKIEELTLYLIEQHFIIKIHILNNAHLDSI